MSDTHAMETPIALPLLGPMPVASLRDVLALAACTWPPVPDGAQVSLKVDTRGVSIAATGSYSSNFAGLAVTGPAAGTYNLLSLARSGALTLSVDQDGDLLSSDALAIATAGASSGTTPGITAIRRPARSPWWPAPSVSSSATSAPARCTPSRRCSTHTSA